MMIPMQKQTSLRNAPAQPHVRPVMDAAWRDWRIVLWISAALSAASLHYLITWADGTGLWLGHFARGWLIRMLPVICLGLAAGWAAWTGKIPWKERLFGWAGMADRGLRRLGAFNLVFFVLLWFAFLAIIWSPQAELIERSLPRAWIMGHMALLGGVFIKAISRNKGYFTGAVLSLLGFSAALKILSFVPAVSAYPFMIPGNWSEISRYYYASLFFSKSIYGEAFSLPVLHPSRYLLQSIPFLIPSLPLWFHRFWQVFLWLGLTTLGGYALARRLRLSARIQIVLVTVWAVLFFFQGAVYYHLMVCVILVLLGFDSSRHGAWRNFLVVALASLWAGISRVNWIPVPGMLAACLYLLETPSEGRSFGRYWLPPWAWVALGTLAGLGAQAGYAVLSGNDLGEFGSSFSSDLLWYRLYPNSTFPPGILRAVEIVSLPILLVLAYRLYRSAAAWRPLRWLGITAILVVLFGVGLIVSVKIGGGGDLHNMDAYLTLLAVVGAYLVFDRYVPDNPGRVAPFKLNWVLLTLALAIPVLPVLRLAPFVEGPAPQAAQAELAELQGYLDQVSTDPREVLFVAERHLITFNLVRGVRMVPDYEKVFLMEMAMANNQLYLQTFREDLRRHRFSLIVTDGMNVVIKDQNYSFGEENNAWVERVTVPVLENYTKKADLDLAGLSVFVPNP